MNSTTDPARRGTDQPLVSLKAGDVMTGDVATVTITTTVGQAMTMMHALGIRHLPMLDGRLVGIVDERMAAFALLHAGGVADAPEQQVSTAMTHDVAQVGPGELLHRIAHLLRTSRCDAIVVIDAQDHMLGIATMVDVVTALAMGDVELPSTPEPAGVPLRIPSAVATVTPVLATAARS